MEQFAKIISIYRVVVFAISTVFQVRDFQLVGQWAEGLNGILSPQVVQERCILKMVKIKVDLFYVTRL